MIVQVRNDGWYEMTDAAVPWGADPLEWGQGPCVLDAFIEPTYPFPVLALGKFDELLRRTHEDRITLKMRPQSQPWHMFSGLVIRCVLAASTLPAGKRAARQVLDAAAARREEFEFDTHCSGPNMGATPAGSIRHLEARSSLGLAGPFAYPELDEAVEWHTRYARQNGIHSSPTFMVGGLVQAAVSSRGPVDNWLARLPG